MRTATPFFPTMAGLAGLLLTACAGGEGGAFLADGTATTFERASVSIARNVQAAHDLDLEEAYRRAFAAAGEDGPRPNLDGIRMAALDTRLPAGVTLPVIVYSHGCSGLSISSVGHLQELARLDDFVVVAPKSFARSRPPYCFSDFSVDLNIRDQVIAMRSSELSHALAQLAARPWVDRDNIFLIGHSQGASVVAGYGGPVPIRARILLNGGCHAGYGGAGFGDGEPVLSLDSGLDPWFLGSGAHCRRMVLAHSAGETVWEPRSRSHNLALTHWPTVTGFLERHRR